MVKAKDVIKLADSHKGERYILGSRVPLDNAKWKGPWDCAEFVSWIAFQTTGLMNGCTDNNANPALAEPYSGAWARDAMRSARPIGLGQARGTAGAVLVRKPGQNGIGHVSLSRGGGTTIEAHSSARGVTHDTVDGRRWDFAMLLPLIDYPGVSSQDVFAPPAGLVLRLTDPPMQGAMVRRLQKALRDRGYDPGTVDGIFGPHTDAAVRAFQMEKGLAADGEAGARTLAELGS